MIGECRKFPGVALAACAFGLVVCPLFFLAIGALSDFSAAFTRVALPPLLLGVGFLLWRFLSTPDAQPRSRAMFVVLEVLSFVTIVAFLVVISSFRLLRGLERLGLISQFFLAGTVIGLVVVLARRTALEERMARVPKGPGTLALILILLLAGVAAVVKLARPPDFL